MGAKRKTKTFTLTEKSPPSSSLNCSVSARNLGKPELGGVIFGCKNNTIEECICKQLFGLPAPHISYVKHIRPGLPLFLFNYSDRKLHGVFEAASEGRMNIDPHGWTEDGSECTLFPAQVRIRIRMQCQPLLEDQFGPVISDNYFKPRRFWFELDQTQTTNLIFMFSSSPVTESTAPLRRTAKLCTLLNATCLSNSRQKGGSERATLDVNLANQDQRKLGRGSCGDGIASSVQSKSLEYKVDYVAEQEHKFTHVTLNSGHSYSSAVSNCDHSMVHSKQDHTGQSSLDTHALDEENRSLDESYSEEARRVVQENSSLPHTKWSDLFANSVTGEKVEVKESETLNSELNPPTLDQFNSTRASSCNGPDLDGNGNPLQDFVGEPRLFYEQSDCMTQQKEALYLSVAIDNDACLPQIAPSENLSTADLEGNTSWSDRPEIENCCLSEADLLPDVKLRGLKFTVDKILLEVDKLKLNQFKQDQKISSLEEELVESRWELKKLKQQLKISECSSHQETYVVMKSESSI